MFKREEDWIKFSTKVQDHIKNYTVNQYGDKGEDLASEYTAEHCLNQVKKYIARHGRNQREGQDELDLFKAAHYLQMVFSLKEPNND